MSAVRVERDGDVAVLVLDVPGQSVNTLSRAVQVEFTAALRAALDDAAVRGVVLLSGKPDTFIAGADIEEFVAAGTAADLTRLSRDGQQLLEGVARARKPVVAAINGTCLGGGVELALACHYRVASLHPKTALGLPEVQLGIIPGAGGCNRLPALVGLRAALDMILTSKNVKADRARRMGLVDEAVAAPILRDVAVAAARKVAAHGPPPRRGRPAGLLSALLDGTALGQAFVLAQARKMTLKRTGGHYPAPLAAIEAVRYSLAHGIERGLVREAELFGQMGATDVSRRLVEIFFATTALKKDPGVAEPAPKPRPVTRLGILGAGFMGSGIATVAADQAGFEVRLKDADLPRVGKGLKAVADAMQARVKRRSITRFDAVRKIALVSGGVDYAGFTQADLVIEAVFEDVEVKRAVLREVEAVARPGAIFASNTSTIPIARIAEASRHPETVIGMHFFSPVQRMPLLEIIVTDRTAPETTVTCVAAGRRMGKTVIVVRDRPGFFINRILSPYMNETGRLLAEGAHIEDIDRAMTSWGFPVGPVALLDEVGLDVAVKAGKVMHDAFGERLAPAIPMEALVKDGRLGRKSGRGFYRYAKGRKAGPDAAAYALIGVTPAAGAAVTPVSATVITERLSLAMLNEAARAYEEGVVRSPRDGDIGAIYGIGYPPFRGGPFRTLDAIGAAAAVAALERLASTLGPRFAPAAVLVEQAKTGTRFYP